MGSYTATLEDPEARLLSCSTTQHSCNVTSLHCGQRYRVSVFHHDGVCPSMPSSPVYMESGGSSGCMDGSAGTLVGSA